MFLFLNNYSVSCPVLGVRLNCQTDTPCGVNILYYIGLNGMLGDEEHMYPLSTSTDESLNPPSG